MIDGVVEVNSLFTTGLLKVNEQYWNTIVDVSEAIHLSQLRDGDLLCHSLYAELIRNLDNESPIRSLSDLGSLSR